jgi:two-component system chemotaxis sensor kinase CheA
MDVGQVLGSFVAESRELLDEMEAALLECERRGATTDLVHAVFRAAHTLKGAAGIFGIDDIVAFTHVVETVLDRMRGGMLRMSDDLASLLLQCTDELRRLVEDVSVTGVREGRQLGPAAAALLDALREASGDDSAPGNQERSTSGAQAESASARAVLQSDAVPVIHADRPCAATPNWHLSLRFSAGVLANGMDPLSFLRYLTTFGSIAGMHVIEEGLPALEDMSPEDCYLGFELSYATSADRAKIEGAFEFVREDCRLVLLPPGSPLSDYAELIRTSREPEQVMRTALIQCGTLTDAEVERALEKAAAPTDAAAPDGGARAQVPDAHPAGGEARAADRRSIRVDADKLDRLIDLIGELIVAGANTNLIASRIGLAELGESASRLLRLVQEVRDCALTLRTVQIGATFARFHRVVRDVARQVGKDIELRISGAETELDKTVVERIADPLVHLVRNAIDHGIEPAHERRTRGKPERATVHLHAYHDSGTVVIEVRDDGGGIDADKVRARAIERGLIPADAVLSERDIFNLIMEPGFSTADRVTDLSGRGVGMDVVKRNVEELRGSIEIESEKGVGTTMRIRLPLTLAIIDGFRLQVGSACYVVPLELVEECVEIPEGHGADGNQFLDLRGTVLPCLRLRDLFGVRGPGPRRESAIVVRSAGERIGLVVDALLGELQTVIKPLGQVFRNLRGIAGSTILGSGSVALILDVPALIQLAAQRQADHGAVTSFPRLAAATL